MSPYLNIFKFCLLKRNPSRQEERDGDDSGPIAHQISHSMVSLSCCFAWIKVELNWIELNWVLLCWPHTQKHVHSTHLRLTFLPLLLRLPNAAHSKATEPGHFGADSFPGAHFGRLTGRKSLIGPGFPKMSWEDKVPKYYVAHTHTKLPNSLQNCLCGLMRQTFGPWLTHLPYLQTMCSSLNKNHHYPPFWCFKSIIIVHCIFKYRMWFLYKRPKCGNYCLFCRTFISDSFA